MAGRPWEERELIKLRTGFEGGISVEKLSEELKRTPSAIYHKSDRLGLNREFPAEVSKALIARRNGQYVPQYSDVEAKILAWSIAWEGTISFYRIRQRPCMPGNLLFSPCILLSNTDQALLDNFIRIARCGYRNFFKKPRNGNRKPVYEWKLWGINKVYDFLQQIFPYLPAKKKQAELVLRFCELRKEKNYATHSYGDEEWNMFKEMKKTNQRGLRNT